MVNELEDKCWHECKWVVDGNAYRLPEIAVHFKADVCLGSIDNDIAKTRDVSGDEYQAPSPTAVIMSILPPPGEDKGDFDFGYIPTGFTDRGQR